MNQGFSKIWIVSIIFTLLIIFVGGFLIYWVLVNIIKAEIPCSPPYWIECKNIRDCLSQTKCQVGQGMICLPQCKYEGYDFSCVKGRCIWSKGRIVPLEKI